MEKSQESLPSKSPTEILVDQVAKEQVPFVQSEEGKEAERKYAEHLKNGGRVEKPATLDDFMRNINHAHIRLPEKRKQVMPYDDGKKLFHAIAKGLGDFEYNDFNKPILPMLVKWFIADPSGDLDLDRGILLTGMPGIGKTHLFRIFNIMVNSYNNRAHEFKTWYCVGLYDSISSKKTKIDTYFSGHALFDDLGTETRTTEAVVKDYGNVKSPIDDIIFERERKWELHRQITHFTSNLSPQALEKRYGDRTWDRIRNLCNVVYNSQAASFRGAKHGPDTNTNINP